MSNPIEVRGYNWWYGDHDPGASETTVSGTIVQYDNYIREDTGERWICEDATPDALVWVKGDNSGNLNTSRNYTSVSSPTFNTSRTPSATTDTLVLATVHINATILQNSTLSVQIDSGSGFAEIGRISTTLGVLVNEDELLTFIVPANCAYKIVSSGTGTNSIVSFKEISL